MHTPSHSMQWAFDDRQDTDKPVLLTSCMQCIRMCMHYTNLMQVPSILCRANQIVSAVNHCGWDVSYFVQIVHDPAIMVKPPTVDKEMTAAIRKGYRQHKLLDTGKATSQLQASHMYTATNESQLLTDIKLRACRYWCLSRSSCDTFVIPMLH